MKCTILCVDDEKIVLNSLRTQLKEALGNEFKYAFAESAEEALEVLEIVAEKGRTVIIVSDWLMPGIKGDEFLISAHKKWPDIVGIILTGHADEEAINRAKKEANLHACLSKPWDKQELINEIKTGIQGLYAIDSKG